MVLGSGNLWPTGIINSLHIKDFFSHISFSVFGKFIEETRAYKSCKICTTATSLKKWMTCPRFISMKIISEKIVIIFLSVPAFKLNKPITVGFSILELAKYFMYDKYYNIIKPSLGDCEVLMSDTDSLLMSVKEKGKNIDKLRKIIDFSNYPIADPHFNTSKKNELGFFKDELCGGKIKQFCGLRSKTYAFEVQSSKYDNKKINLNIKCKGITKGYKKRIKFSDYLNCVKTIDSYEIEQFQIRSKTHKVFTAKIKKLAFSSFDDKRYLLNCGIHSLAYGHYMLRDGDIDCPYCTILH